MEPMELSFTPITYQEIQVEEIELLEDAWGFNSEFSEVMKLLGQIKTSPGKSITDKLIEKIRNQDF